VIDGISIIKISVSICCKKDEQILPEKQKEEQLRSIGFLVD
jgi:hypothetical protein